MALRFLIFFLFIFPIFALDLSDISDREVRNFFKESNYARAFPPSDDATTVKVGVYINHMQVDEANHVLKLHAYLRQQWADPRFRDLTNVYTNYDSGNQIKFEGAAIDYTWRPDTFMRNALNVKTFEAPTDQRLFRLKNNNVVWFVQTINVELGCNTTDAKSKYLTCSVMFESYASTSNVMVFDWLKNTVDLDPAIDIKGYTLKEYQKIDCSQNYTTGAFPCAEVKFFLERDYTDPFSKGLISVTFLLTLLSWIGFWIDGDKVFQRAGFGLLVILVLVVGNLGAKTVQSLKHSFGMQLWTSFCVIFSTLTLVEYLIVHVIIRMVPQKIKEARRPNKRNEKESTPVVSKFTTLANRIDVFCGLIAFPAIFLIFNLYFWCSVHSQRGL